MIPGQQPGTLKYPQLPVGTSADAFASAGCHFQSPLMQIRSARGRGLAFRLAQVPYGLDARGQKCGILLPPGPRAEAPR